MKNFLFLIIFFLTSLAYSQQTVTLTQGTTNSTNVTLTKTTDFVNITIGHISPDSTQVDSIAVYGIINNRKVRLSGTEQLSRRMDTVFTVGKNALTFNCSSIGATMFEVKYANTETVYNRKTFIVFAMTSSQLVPKTENSSYYNLSAEQRDSLINGIVEGINSENYAMNYFAWSDTVDADGQDSVCRFIADSLDVISCFTDWYKIKVSTDSLLYLSSDISFPANKTLTIPPGSFTTEKLSVDIINWYIKSGVTVSNYKIVVEGN